jgi:tetratricopeptide (TPR) repeat protein
MRENIQREVMVRSVIATAAAALIFVPVGLCQSQAAASGAESDPYVLGLRAFKQGDVRKALTQFEAAARLRPHDAVVANALGNTWFALEEPGKAREEYQRAIRLDSALGAAYKNLGVLECQKGNWTQAQASLVLAAKLLPEDPVVWRFLGRAEAENRQPGDAAAALDRAVHLQPGDQELQLAEGRALLASGQFKQAADFLHSCGPAGKDSAPFDLLLGEAELGEGLATEAAQDYRQAILTDPKRNEPYLRLSWLYAEHHHFDAAEQTLREGLQFAAEPYPVLLQLGRVLALGGQEERATAVLNQAIREHPRDPQAYVTLIIAYSLLDTSQQKSIETAELALRRCPNNYLLDYLHAGLLLRKQRETINDTRAQTQKVTDAIRSELEESIRLNPDFPHSHYDLARMEFEDREYSKAERQVKAALSADPQFMSAHYLLGRIYLKQGRSAAGMSEIQLVDSEHREEIQRMQEVGQKLLSQQASGVTSRSAVAMSAPSSSTPLSQ